MIEIEKLSFAWPGQPPCVQIESWAIAQGSSIFLHGPSGSGKSTLLGLLAGVLLPQQGQVRCLGTSWNQLSAAQRDPFRADHMGYLFQQFNLLPYLSALDNVLLTSHFSALRRQRLGAAALKEQAQTWLEQMQLPRALWSAPAARLSVGQQQRVAAARALFGQPEIVIADEPTSALDAALCEHFMGLLQSACQRSRSTLVFVSHDERLAARFDQQVSMQDLNRAMPALSLE